MRSTVFSHAATSVSARRPTTRCCPLSSLPAAYAGSAVPGIPGCPAPRYSGGPQCEIRAFPLLVPSPTAQSICLGHPGVSGNPGETLRIDSARSSSRGCGRASPVPESARGSGSDLRPPTGPPPGFRRTAAAAGTATAHQSWASRLFTSAESDRGTIRSWSRCSRTISYTSGISMLALAEGHHDGNVKQLHLWQCRLSGCVAVNNQAGCIVPPRRK